MADNDWEHRKLEQISDKVTEKNKQETFKEVLTNSAEFGIVSQESYFDKEIANVKNISGYYIVRPNDFVYNPRISNFAPVGPIKRNTLFITGIMSPLYYVFRTKNISTTYLQKYFESTHWHRFMYMNGDSGARSDRFAIKDTTFNEMPIPYPVFEEQKSIANFISKLDKIITLHQRKINTLKEQKKAYFRRVLVEKSENKPILRFKNFYGKWSNDKLENLFEYGGSGGTPKSTVKEYYEGNIPFLSISDISNSDGYINRTEKSISQKGLDNSAAWIVPKGAMSLAMYASVGKLAILNIEVATSQAFYNMVFKDDNLRDFVYQSLLKTNELNGWDSLVSTGTQKI